MDLLNSAIAALWRYGSPVATKYAFDAIQKALSRSGVDYELGSEVYTELMDVYNKISDSKQITDDDMDIIYALYQKAATFAKPINIKDVEWLEPYEEHFLNNMDSYEKARTINKNINTPLTTPSPPSLFDTMKSHAGTLWEKAKKNKRTGETTNLKEGMAQQYDPSRTYLNKEYFIPPGVDPDKIQYTVPLHKSRPPKPLPWEKLTRREWYDKLPDAEKFAYQRKLITRGSKKRKRYTRRNKYTRRAMYKRRRVRGRGAYFSTVSGLGSYNLKKNSLADKIDMGTDPPQICNTKTGEATIVNHREYITDITTGAPVGGISAFNLQSFAINPGNNQLFPWLQDIAQNYQEWEPRGIIIELKTLGSDYANSVTLGSMFMGVDYTSMAANRPTTKQQVENLEYSTSSKPSRSQIMPIECAPQNDTLTHFYVAINGNYNGSDIRFCDLGILYVGTSGIPVAQPVPVAEMWISYEVALYKPRLYTTPSSTNVYTAHLRMNGVATVNGMLGTSYVTEFNVGGFNFAATPLSNDMTVYFPASTVQLYYLVIFQYSFATAHTVVNTSAFAAYGGTVLDQAWASTGGGNTVHLVGCSPGESTFHYWWAYTALVPPNSGGTAYVTISNADNFATSGYADIWATSTGGVIA